MNPYLGVDGGELNGGDAFEEVGVLRVEAGWGAAVADVAAQLAEKGCRGGSVALHMETTA